jgi:3-oxoacyl-[acyl-carrier protein] reductase
MYLGDHGPYDTPQSGFYHPEFVQNYRIFPAPGTGGKNGRSGITMRVTAYIALGSNLDDRRGYLDGALQALREKPGIAVIQVSAYYETTPVGGPPGQGNYLNAVAELGTDLEPEEILRTLLEIEAGLGRVRDVPQGPRTIDLDLLLYQHLVRRERDPIVPHPRMHERLFVLEPLAEIAPNVRHPVLGKTIRELCAELQRTERTAPGAPRSAELAGLRALVTGSTSGIGRAIALEFAAAGAEVIIHGRNAAAAEAVSAELRALGRRGPIILADLRTAEECLRLVRGAWEESGGLDIWVNNAGVDTLTGEAGHWPFPRKLSELLTLDVTATVLLAREVGQRMKTRGDGVLLNMGWDQAETGMEGDSGQLFAASKGAVMAFSKSLALTLAPEVRVNCLAPGWIQTAWGQKASETWQERVRRETPLGRWGTPQDVAAVARWLVSPAAAYITGQIIRVNGGAVR